MLLRRKMSTKRVSLDVSSDHGDEGAKAKSSFNDERVMVATHVTTSTFLDEQSFHIRRQAEASEQSVSTYLKHWGLCIRAHVLRDSLLLGALTLRLVGQEASNAIKNTLETFAHDVSSRLPLVRGCLAMNEVPTG